LQRLESVCIYLICVISKIDNVLFNYFHGFESEPNNRYKKNETKITFLLRNDVAACCN